jgi:purine-binding chemotaxis protein CheW
MSATSKTKKSKPSIQKSNGANNSSAKKKLAGQPKTKTKSGKTRKKKAITKVVDQRQLGQSDLGFTTHLEEKIVLPGNLMREEIVPDPESYSKSDVEVESVRDRETISSYEMEMPAETAGPEVLNDETRKTSPTKDKDIKEVLAQEELQLVCFMLDNEEYGVNINKVQEINRIPDINSVPDAAPYVKGVVNLRGRIIPVIELRLLLGLTEVDYDNKTRIIVLDNNGMLTGMVVDNVTQVLRVCRSMIVETPGIAEIPGRKFLEGIYQNDNKLILVIDCDKIFSFNVEIKRHNDEETIS